MQQGAGKRRPGVVSHVQGGGQDVRIHDDFRKEQRRTRADEAEAERERERGGDRGGRGGEENGWSPAVRVGGVEQGRAGGPAWRRRAGPA